MPPPVARFHTLDPSLPDLRGKHRTEPLPPSPHGLVANVDATLMKQLLDVASGSRNRMYVLKAKRMFSGLL